MVENSNFLPIQIVPEKSALESLEDLVLDNDLDKLESITSNFNIFEALGAVRRELRHSDLLAFLLNPFENHGLSDTFLKAFLFNVAKVNRAVSSVSPIDIDLFDFSDIDVRREWENIDLLLVSEKSNLVCAIENKIDTKEGVNQLSRYQSTIESEFKHYKKLFIYLTVAGDDPEKDKDWLPYSYSDVRENISTILNESGRSVGEDVCVLLTHYIEMIDRHFMTENEIAKLSRKIYQRHKKALDLIFEHRPDELTETNTYIVEVLKNYLTVDEEFDHCSKAYVRFAVKRWDAVDGQLSGSGQWTKTDRVILFEVVNSPAEIAVKLIVGPGDRAFREKVYSVSGEKPKLFKARSKSLYEKWTQIYKRKLVTKAQMGLDLESVKNLIQQELEKFYYHGEFQELCAFLDDVLDTSND